MADNLFARVTTTQRGVNALRQLADLTNPATQGALRSYMGYDPTDRYAGRHPDLVMASFCYPLSPSRFTDGTFGVLYVAQNDDTAIAETVYHRTRVYRDSAAGPSTAEMALLSIGFHATSVDIRTGCPQPVNVYHPTDYAVGQQLGLALSATRTEGIAYESVRATGNHCVGILRPAVVSDTAVIGSLQYAWDGHTIRVV